MYIHMYKHKLTHTHTHTHTQTLTHTLLGGGGGESTHKRNSQKSIHQQSHARSKCSMLKAYIFQLLHTHFYMHNTLLKVAYIKRASRRVDRKIEEQALTLGHPVKGKILVNTPNMSCLTPTFERVVHLAAAILRCRQVGCL